MARHKDSKSSRHAADRLVRSALSSPLDDAARPASAADEDDQSLLGLWVDAGELKYSEQYAALLGSPTWRERWVTFRSRLAVPRPRFVIPAVSTMALAAIAAYMLLPQPTRYEAGREARAVILPDRSSILLAPSSRIDFQMHDGKRMAHLLGSAQFSVAHDAEHPFLVAVGDAQVRVIGTRFTLSYRAPCTQLSVLSGTVAIQSQSMPKRLLHAGEATVNIDANQSSLSCGGGQSAASDLRLSYVDAPLSNVIDDVRRFYPQKIVIESADLADEHVTMSFSITEIGDVLETLPRIMSATVRRGEDGTVYLIR